MGREGRRLQAQKTPYLLGGACGIGKERFTAQHQQLLLWEVLDVTLQLMPIAAALQIAVFLMAAVAFTPGEGLVRALKPLGLGGQGGHQRQIFQAQAHGMEILRQGPVHRVAQQHDQPGLGSVAGDALGSQRVKQVIGRGLAAARAIAQASDQAAAEG